MASLLCGPKPHPWAPVIEEFDSRLFKCSYNAVQGIRPCTDGAIEPFHSEDGPKSHLRPLRKVALRPPQQRASRANVSARYDDQAKRYHAWADKLN